MKKLVYLLIIACLLSLNMAFAQWPDVVQTSWNLENTNTGKTYYNMGQSFNVTSNATEITMISFRVRRDAASTSTNTVFNIRNNSITGTILGNASIPTASMPASASTSVWMNWTFSPGVPVTPGGTYYIDYYGTGTVQNTNEWRVSRSTLNPYHNGSEYSSSTAQPTADLAFIIWANTSVTPPVVTPNFTLTVKDQLTGLNVSSLNVTLTYNGSSWSYLNVNSPVPTNITFNSSLVNVSVSKAKYFSNVTLGHDTVTNLTMSILGWPEIRGYDIYNGTNLTDFSVIWNGTNYTGASSVLRIPARGIINFSVIRSYYFPNVSVNYAIKTGYTAAMKPYPLISAYSIYNVTSFSDFWVYYNGTNYTASQIYLPVPLVGSADFNISRVGFFVNQTVSETVGQRFNASLFPYTEIFAVTHTGATINNFSINYSGSTYVTNQGIVYLPLYNESSDVTIFNAYVGSTNYESKTRLLNATPFLKNYTYVLFFSNSFLIDFKNETTDLPIVNTTVTLELISSGFAQNYTTSNGSLNITLIVPDDYELRYWIDPDVPRSYFVTLTNQSVETLILYVIEEALSDFYLPVLVDQAGLPCQNNTVSLLRYFISPNTYRIVEMARTSSQGQAVLRVQPNIVDYKFAFSGSCGSFVTNPAKLVDSTDTYTIGSSQAVLSSTYALANVLSNLTYINATNTYVFTWLDSTNLVTEGCLMVKKTKNGATTTVNNACSGGASGSLFYTLTDLNNSIYTAQGRIETNTEFSTFYTTPLTVNLLTALQVFGLTGVFLTLMIVVAAALAFSTSVAMTLIATISALGLTIALGLFAASWSWIAGLSVLAGVLIYKLRRG